MKDPHRDIPAPRPECPAGGVTEAVSYDLEMAQIRVQRDALARMLRSHGEDDLAERAVSITDDEVTRIGTLGAYYARARPTPSRSRSP